MMFRSKSLGQEPWKAEALKEQLIAFGICWLIALYNYWNDTTIKLILFSLPIVYFSFLTILNAINTPRKYPCIFRKRYVSDAGHELFNLELEADLPFIPFLGLEIDSRLPKEKFSFAAKIQKISWDEARWQGASFICEQDQAIPVSDEDAQAWVSGNPKRPKQSEDTWPTWQRLLCQEMVNDMAGGWRVKYPEDGPSFFALDAEASLKTYVPALIQKGYDEHWPELKQVAALLDARSAKPTPIKKSRFHKIRQLFAR